MPCYHSYTARGSAGRCLLLGPEHQFAAPQRRLRFGVLRTCRRSRFGVQLELARPDFGLEQRANEHALRVRWTRLAVAVAAGLGEGLAVLFASSAALVMVR